MDEDFSFTGPPLQLVARQLTRRACLYLRARATAQAVPNGDVVKRTAALKHSGPGKLIFREGTLHYDWKSALVDTVRLLVMLTMVVCPPIAAVLLWLKLLPAPGEGPARRKLDRMWLRVVGTGVGAGGTRIDSVLYNPRDPGYLDTARMLVESGLCLAVDRAELPAGGGCLTPGFALGIVLLRRLQRGGTEFAVQMSGDAA